MPEPKRPLKVFLCHAHADRDPVRGLYARLTKDGVDAWLDKAKLLPGQDWELEIRKAVREADVVVVCLSKQFNQAGFRQKEVRLALDTAMEKPEGEIFIIPARLEECDTLESLRKWHWVDLFEDDGYEMLMRALRARADRIGATLQIKKNWLPIVNTQPTVVKKPSTPMERPVEKKQEKPKPQKEIQWTRIFNKTTIGIAGFVALALLAIFSLRQLIGKPDPHSTATNTANLKTFTPIPATPCGTASGNWDVYVVKTGDTVVSIAVAHNMTVEELLALNCISGSNQIVLGQELLIPKASQTEVPPTTSIVTPLQTEITDAKGVTMVLVPAGEFMMGIGLDETLALCKYYYWSADICDQKSSIYQDQSPPHLVDLSSYYIDKYEVTNFQYAACVDAGMCSLPKVISSGSRDIYYGNPTYDNYPVSVNWGQSNSFCEWRGARLPTEAEWEKAARGTTDERVFPWGATINCENANFSNCGGSMNTLPVGSYEKGKSPYEVYDMAGNYSEFVSDWYGSDYYQNSPSLNPTGPATGEYHVIRGGGNGNFGYFLSSVYRGKGDSGGFRCAKDAP